ncbi:NUDIX domain-containing protein [Streptomyces sp. NPDC051985]|uniref:NUDIX domain-containing protein n=1 Tax=Streptomyces sp. NPDC051985 TaxID=3155807 RepID=UPI00342EF1C2
MSPAAADRTAVPSVGPAGGAQSSDVDRWSVAMSAVYGEGPARLAPRGPERGTVVAVVLTWRGRVGLFKRSRHVGHDAGLWHCVTGFVDDGNSPQAQALRELFEETGVTVAELTGFRTGPVLDLADARGGVWRVHTFQAETERRRLRLNWEHDSYRWVRTRFLTRYDGQVPWLREVLNAVVTQAHR